MARKIALLVALSLILFRAAGLTQEQPLAQERHLSLEVLYDPEARVNFSGSTPTILGWLDDAHYLEATADPPADAPLLRVNAASGASTPFYDADQMEAAFASLPGFSEATARGLARRGRYQMNDSRTAILVNQNNDLFYYELGGDHAVRLTSTPEPEVGEEFSPDGKLISFVRNYNVYVVDPATLRERALTHGGSAELHNGRLDWVYQEELYGRGNFKGYWWSPDSTRIVYLELDESPVKEFVVIDHIPYRPTLEVTNYPKAGDPNPDVRLGVVDVLGGPSRWVDTFKYQAFDHLIVRVGWTPDGEHVVYQVQDREQTWLDLNRADPESGATETLFRELSEAWVNVTGTPTWLEDGSFLWLSERTGWQHIYYYSPDGKLIRPVTSGAWEARNLHGVDEANGFVYFSGTEQSHTESHVYRIGLDGSGLTRLSRRAGAHRANFNPGFTLYTDTWSDVHTPPQTRLHDSSGDEVRVIEANQVGALADYELGEVEFLQVNTRDGFAMEAMMIRPPDFDPDQEYPVLQFTYAGPHAPMVRNSWGGTRYLWHQMLAQQGYIIWICDNRTASGKGAQSTWLVYRNFGELELRDIEDGLDWLKSNPWVDGSRIGIWGWSYGGFMTSYALTHSTNFKAGIAGAPVTDWRDYDTIYTERYMATPQNNPEGYVNSSPVHAAADLHGKLLIIHGSMDDNVHMQNTIQFIYELEKAGKQFELMIYPKSRHGVRDPELAYHLQRLMTDFILRNL